MADSSGVRQRSSDVIKEKIEKRKEQNQLKKIQDDNQSRNRRRNIKWTIILVLLVSLTWYYYTYQPSSSATASSSPSPSTDSHRVHEKTKNNLNKVNKPSSSNLPPKKKTTPKVTPEKSKKPKNKTPRPTDSKTPPPTPPTPNDENNDLLNTKITDLPILRRPVPPSDPDRPLIMEILEGDDYLKAQNYPVALEKFNAVLKRFKQSPRGLLGKALALEGLAKKKESSKLMDKAIDLFYSLSFESQLASNDFKLAGLISLAECSERRGKVTMVIKALEKAVALEPSHERYSVKLAQAYMKGDKHDKALELLLKVVSKWPENTLAHANLGYLYYRERNYSQALPHLLRGLLENKEIQKSGKFYLYTGETLTRLNKSDEALMVYQEGVARKLFPSVDQRSLFNEPDLRAKSWWTLQETREKGLEELEKKSEDIKNEVESAMVTNADIYSDDKKTVMTLYKKGERQEKACAHFPLLCDLLSKMSSVTTCTRGETKILLFPGSLHIPSHVSLTNTELRGILPLKLGGLLRIRISKETRELSEGKLSIFDDSFEQELLYTGTKGSVVLMLDFWHPDLPELKRKYLHKLLL